MKSLTQASPEALIGLASLSRHPRWADAMGYVERELEAVQERLLTSLDPHETARLQGRALALKAFQETVLRAPDTLAKLGTKVPL